VQVGLRERERGEVLDHLQPLDRTAPGAVTEARIERDMDPFVAARQMDTDEIVELGELRAYLGAGSDLFTTTLNVTADMKQVDAESTTNVVGVAGLDEGQVRVQQIQHC